MVAVEKAQQSYRATAVWLYAQRHKAGIVPTPRSCRLLAPYPLRRRSRPIEIRHDQRLSKNASSRAALVKLHRRIVAHIDRLETALELPPPKPASRRRKR